MADIESREESSALQAAAELIADSYRDDTRGGEVTPEIRQVIRLAWIAGRDWQRGQAVEHGEQLPAVELTRRLEDAAKVDRALAAGLRLLGCPHATSCRSVAECHERSEGRL